MAKTKTQQQTKKKSSFLFELVPVENSAIPTDDKGVKRAPYPELKMVPNSGLALREGLQQEWRYIHSYQASIWKDKQPANLTPAQINDIRNELVFRKGKLTVHAHETAKLEALQIQDIFQGIKDPLQPGKSAVYFMIDEEEHAAGVKETLDDAFEAEKAAREMSRDEMFSIASLFAIDDTQSDAYIRTQLILKAKEHPKTFLRERRNPRTKIRYMLLSAMQENVIHVTNGQLIWTDTDVAMCQVTPGKDAADELAYMWEQKNPQVIKLVDQIERLVVAE